MRRDQLITALLFLLFLVLPAGTYLTGTQSINGLLARIVIFAIAAISLNFIMGHGGLVSFGHAGFFGVGGYVVAILAFHDAEDSRFLGLLHGTNSLVWSLPAAVLVGGAVALPIGFLSLKTRGMSFIMITLAFSQMLFFFFTSLSIYGADDGLSMKTRNVLFNLNLQDDAVFYYVSLIGLLGYAFLCHRALNSRFGMVLQGARDSERRILAVGISVLPYRLVAFVFSAMGASLAGGLFANSDSIFQSRHAAMERVRGNHGDGDLGRHEKRSRASIGRSCLHRQRNAL